MSFEYLEEEAIADIAFKAYGSNLVELFYQAGLATANLQTDINKLNSSERREESIERNDVERLLKNFLDEILYYKDADLFFVKDFEISITESNDKFKLNAVYIGDYFDNEKHEIGNDLKAITYHDFKVKRTEDGWMCYVLIDI